MIPENSSIEGNQTGKTAGHISSEDRGTVTENEGEHDTEGDESGRQIKVKKICSGAPILTRQSYTNNPGGPLREGVIPTTRRYTQLHHGTEHEDNEH